MSKKHCWISNAAMKRLTGIVGTCLDCGESRTTNLKGGVCSGTRELKALGHAETKK